MSYNEKRYIIPRLSLCSIKPESEIMNVMNVVLNVSVKKTERFCMRPVCITDWMHVDTLKCVLYAFMCLYWCDFLLCCSLYPHQIPFGCKIWSNCSLVMRIRFDWLGTDKRSHYLTLTYPEVCSLQLKQSWLRHISKNKTHPSLGNMHLSWIKHYILLCHIATLYTCLNCFPVGKNKQTLRWQAYTKLLAQLS